MSELKNAPVGIFDSGVGGLSVLIEIEKRLPHESLLYFADSGHVPYGNKSPDFIRDRSLKISEFLISKGAKAIVIACNTATASAIGVLRKKWPDMPIIGMEPAVKPALAVTQKGIVGVLATVGTLKSAQFAALLDKFASKTKVVLQPAPGLVECVEAGNLNSQEVRELVKSFVVPLLDKGADTLVLGCTHYPFLKKIIAEIAGPNITLIDTGAAVARQLEKRLVEAHLLLSMNSSRFLEFYTSENPSHSALIVSSLLDRKVIVEKAVF